MNLVCDQVQKSSEEAGLLNKMAKSLNKLGENEQSYNKTDFNCTEDCFQSQ